MMEWNEMFKLLGPLSKSIRQIDKGYSIVFKNRTIFQFKDFSMEVSSIDLFNDRMVLLSGETVKLVPKDQWEQVKYIVF